MATKKSTNKSKAKKHIKKAMKTINKHKGLKVFTIIILLIIIGSVGFFGYKGYNEINTIKSEIEVINENINIASSTSIDLDLPTAITDCNAVIEWKSSDETIIENDGTVHRPTYNEGDKFVTLTANYLYDFQEFASSYLATPLGYTEVNKTFRVKVIALPASDNEIAEIILNNIYVPECTYYDIKLLTNSSFGGNISWESNNSYINEDGTVNTPATDSLAVLSATVQVGTVVKHKEYNITILSSNNVVEEVNDNFDSTTASPNNGAYKDISSNGINYHNSKVLVHEGFVIDDDPNALSSNYIKTKSTKEDFGNFVTDVITNPIKLDFKYLFSGSQSTQSSKLIISASVDNGNTYSVIKEEIVNHLDTYTLVSIDLKTYENVKIKVEHYITWTESTINFEDILITRNPIENDLISFLSLTLPTVISRSIILPTTTSFGGIINWSSSDTTLLDNNGKLLKEVEATTEVTLTANITYGTDTYVSTFDIKVKGSLVGESLEIYFIDLGKYGYSDCGESIYIKYNNYDILIDAGDHFDSTFKAIEEVVDAHIEDQTFEYIIATHPDSDHIGGMPKVFEKYEVKSLIKFHGTYTTGKYTNLVTSWQNEGITPIDIYDDIITKTEENHYINLSDEVKIKFLDTKYYLNEESNGRSIVFLLEAFGTNVLLTGDADNGSGHTDLENMYKDNVGNIDILKAVHHATGAGTTLDFVKAIDPEVTIVCNGNYLGNKHGHPHAYAINNLYQYDSSMNIYAITGGGTIDGEYSSATGAYRCSSEDRFNQRNGTITVVIDANGYTIESEYYNDNPFELSSTTYWNNNPAKQYSHQ